MHQTVHVYRGKRHACFYPALGACAWAHNAPLKRHLSWVSVWTQRLVHVRFVVWSQLSVMKWKKVLLEYLPSQAKWLIWLLKGVQLFCILFLETVFHCITQTTLELTSPGWLQIHDVLVSVHQVLGLMPESPQPQLNKMPAFIRFWFKILSMDSLWPLPHLPPL